jgi:eukaryotic-like serine/threonine-protein kinase
VDTDQTRPQNGTKLGGASAPLESESGAPDDGSTPPIIDGRYALHAQIGRGATGVVWAARDLRAGQAVAIKVLHPGVLETPGARRRFHREVTSAQTLDHPHVVRILGHGQTAKGAPYLVMERLSGQTLSACLSGTAPLPLRRGFRIVAQILEGIAAAHRSNIVHRDLKPGNVILVDAADGREYVKICDFGLAKVVDPNGDGDGAGTSPAPLRSAESVTTGQGDLCGTPEFMAPEQARGEPLDGRADLYSIAVMLFQVVTGELPFAGRTSFAVVSQHLGATPPRPSAVRPDAGITPALDNLILRGLAKDRRERPSSAEVFRADLLQIEADLLRDQRRPAEPRQSSEAATLTGAPAGQGSRPRVTALLLGGAGVVIAVALVAALGAGGGLEAGAPPAGPSVVEQPPWRAATPASVAARTPELPAATAAASLVTPTPPRARKGRATTAARPAPRFEPSTITAPAAPVSTTLPADDDGVSLRRAEDLMAEGQVAGACALVEEAARRSPGAARLHGFLGRCYLRIGRLDEGRASYRRYLELAPSAPDAPFVRAIVQGRR